LLAQGLEFHKAGNIDKAASLYAEVLSRNPLQADALHLLGVLFYQSRNFTHAIKLISQAVAIEPENPVYFLNLGNALQEAGNLARAEESFRRAIGLRQKFAEAYNGLGTTLVGMYRIAEAIDSFNQAILINPNNPEPYNNRGNALRELGDLAGAVLEFEAALRLRPEYADAHSNMGYVFIELNRFEEAIFSFEHALQIDKDFEYVRGALLLTKLRICDWRNHEADVASLLSDLTRSGARCTPPWAVLALSDSPAVQRRAAEIWAADKYPLQDSLGSPSSSPGRSSKRKICIGYYSSDFYHHATSFLIAELFERHDKDRFELIAFHFGPATGDEMQLRVSAAFDSFYDVNGLSDRRVAELSRELGVDIAVDLKGFTQNQRSGIFANRAAPIQVNFLGYPGTMGAEYMDYIIADRELIPEASQKLYTETVVYLPNSYQPNDRKRTISPFVQVRSRLGLPDAGFVFCCFNNNFKINPSVFDAWIDILNSVPGSVMWLLEDNPIASRNLRQAAHQRGLTSERLVFAARVPLAEHLARHSVADLFLDTWPCNAHTTASDSLWAGLPVLSYRGESFASRVGASLLTAAGLPELIVDSREQYIAKAIEFGLNPALVEERKARLLASKMTVPLFDSGLFAQHLESAYLDLYNRYLTRQSQT
jgi:predicted O-linked N-acetylglucosamine transferase (SPINDLY family)